MSAAWAGAQQMIAAHSIAIEVFRITILHRHCRARPGNPSVVKKFRFDGCAGQARA
jgi:hypothetical protein